MFDKLRRSNQISRMLCAYTEPLKFRVRIRNFVLASTTKSSYKSVCQEIFVKIWFIKCFFSTMYLRFMMSKKEFLD